MTLPKRNLYRILDLEPDANRSDILHAYNRSKLSFSEDALASYSMLDAEHKNQLLEEVELAFSILGDSRKKREYDLAQGYKGPQKKVEKPKLRAQSLPRPKKTKRKEVPKQQIKMSLGSIKLAEKIKPIECQELSGPFIQAARERRKLSQEQIAKLCNLKLNYVIAIEREETHLLPHAVYLRGYLILICEVLKITNAEELAQQFIQRLRKEEKIPEAAYSRTLSKHR